jgi:hypothetical protein
MTAPRYAELAAKIMRDSAPGEGAAPSQDARAAAILAIENAIVLRKKRARLRAIGIGASAVAVAAATLLGVIRFAHVNDDAVASVTRSANSAIAHPAAAGADGQSATVVSASGDAHPLKDGDAVTRGTHVTTPAGGRVLLTDATGTRITLGGAADMAIVDEGLSRIYALGRGSLELSVAKLKANERLLVTTKDAEVEVRGTRFHVDVVEAASSCDGKTTRVTVEEGVVVVRRDGVESRVAAGQAWPACAQTQMQTQAQMQMQPQAQTPTQTQPQAQPGTQTLPGTQPQTLPQAQTQLPAPPVVDDRTTLGQENDLYADGLDREHNGDMAGAVATFERYLAKYPQGHLAENAAAERFKILAKTNPARAKTAAREYLARWPKGASRTEANAIVNGSP